MIPLRLFSIFYEPRYFKTWLLFLVNVARKTNVLLKYMNQQS